MIKFLIKGLLRDKSRSRSPIIIVAIGVMLTVFIHSYINGFMGDAIELNARFSSGHLKVMTKAYADNSSQIPNDLALLNVTDLLEKLNLQYPTLKWVSRIQFGGLVDSPDKFGNTLFQGPAMGMAMDFLSGKSGENERLRIEKTIVRGTLIQAPGEALISENFAKKLQVDPGDTITFIGSTMNGSMSMFNFKIAGTVLFGAEAIDRGTLLIDIQDAQRALDMENAAGEIVGFFTDGFYDDELAIAMAQDFNTHFYDETNEFSPLMKSLSQQGNMGQYVEMSKVWSTYISMIFVMAMAIVLWNAGLLGGLRRYGEFGIRLAMGEEKLHVYGTLIYEAIFIGLIGTIIGTAVGLFLAFLLQTYGIDISGMMEGAAIMLPSVIRAKITVADFYLGFIPGLLSTVLGAALAGIGIFKRKTAQLFKELET
ncbi:MAG TPA: hypothetical protein DCG69_04420 [Bacteroidales bacterium]|nr:hypothetical protein [Bacteroidales bacterium]